MRVLIGCASRFGSTRDIAMRIADPIRTHGNEVDVRSVEEISDCDPYDAALLTLAVLTRRGQDRGPSPRNLRRSQP